MPRPAFLAGREKLLKELDTELSPLDGTGPRIVALCGLGGAGKTSMALEYAHRHLAGLGVVWQFPAEEPTALAAAFGALAAQLGARGLLDVGDPVAQVHAVLAARSGDWLLIFDNAPDLTAIESFLPPAGQGRVLITSQNPHWPGGQPLDVPMLDQEVAAEFLQTRTSSTDHGAAWSLAGELGGLPLALEQAAAYMVATGRSIAEYLAMFQERRSDLLARGEPIGYDKRVATTWMLALDELQRTAPSAIGLLRLLACCAPELIPLRLLLQPWPEYSDALPAELVPLLNDALAADDALVSLRHFSLVSSPQNGLVSVHRLVQAVTLAQLPEDRARKWRQAARSVIEAALPEDPKQPETWPVWAVLLPHAEVTLPAESQGLTRVANFLGYKANYSAARSLFHKIVGADQRVLGAEHPDTLSARGRLAFWTGEAGDPAAARDQVAELLPIREGVLGDEHPDTLTDRANLAYYTGAAGDPATARDQFAALLPIRERVLGDEHPRTLTTRADLAYWTWQAGDPIAARDQFAALLKIREQVLGEEDPDILTDRANLSPSSTEAGHPTAAHEHFAALLPVSERVLGAEHPDTLTDRANLAYLTGLAGDPAAARDQFTALLPIIKRVLGAEHADTLTVRSNLARWTGEAGDPATARDQFTALLPSIERLLSVDDQRTLTVRSNLARWTGEAGDPATARDQFTTLLPIRERVLGAEHPSTLSARGNLAYWTEEAGDTAAARDQFLALLPVMERVLGVEHPHTLNDRARLMDWIREADRLAGK